MKCREDAEQFEPYLRVSGVNVNSKWMVNIVVDFIEVARSDVSMNINLNINSNHMKAKVARGAVDAKQNVGLVLDASVSLQVTQSALLLEVTYSHYGYF
jgi:hypothetical protein